MNVDLNLSNNARVLVAAVNSHCVPVVGVTTLLDHDEFDSHEFDTLLDHDEFDSHR